MKRLNPLRNLLALNAGRGEFRAEGNTLYLYDMIVSSEADAEWLGGVAGETIVKALAGLSGNVALRINSPGGDVFAGVAIANAIRSYEGKVTAYVDGLAASAASAVAVACDEVVMAQGSMLMIHNAWTIALGNRHDFAATADLLGKIDADLAATYARRASDEAHNAEYFAGLMDAETWFSAAEAVDEGLADRIADDKAKPKAMSRFDLSAFKAPPAVEAEPEPEQNIETPAPVALDLAEHRARVHALRVRQTI